MAELPPKTPAMSELLNIQVSAYDSACLSGLINCELERVVRLKSRAPHVLDGEIGKHFTAYLGQLHNCAVAVDLARMEFVQRPRKKKRG